MAKKKYIYVKDIDKPLYTIEVKNDTIYQIKGKSNRLVSDAEVDIWKIIHILEDKLENFKLLTKVS